MDKLMMPFVYIYRGVHKVISIPAKLLNKTGDKVLEAKDKTELKKAEKENKTLAQNNVSYVEQAPQQNLDAPVAAAAPAAPTVPVNDELANFQTNTNQKEKKARPPLIGFKYTILNT